MYMWSHTHISLAVAPIYCKAAIY